MQAGISNVLDITRKSLNGSICRTRRSEIGQFFTPSSIACFMASMLGLNSAEVRLLDPGAGAGVLFASCVENMLSLDNFPDSIKVVAYETDPDMLPYLADTIKLCQKLCENRGVLFRAEIRAEDFVDSAVSRVRKGLFSTDTEGFTHAIINPPYKKINSESRMRKNLSAAGIEVSNLYAAFVWLAALMLEPNGEMAAITPRSFCNGPYFRKFRTNLLDIMSLRRIHLFNSRKKAFGDDGVLQENIIYHAVKTTSKSEHVLLTSSEDADFNSLAMRPTSYNNIVFPKDNDAFIHLAISEEEAVAAKRMSRFTASLAQLGMDVSTGPVVDFRVSEHLRSRSGINIVPLIYPAHFRNGFIVWPISFNKKPDAIEASGDAKNLLVNSGYYVLTKRFSSKEEKRRVVAAVYDPEAIKFQQFGIENHINYFHNNGKGLPGNIAKGLMLYLNSTLVDMYFRRFSGHTQVNATDLRKMRYPTLQQLQRLGAYVKDAMPEQEKIDMLLKKECEDNGTEPR